MRWQLNSQSNRVHLAVEGSCGGTTVGLHLAADAISDGGRVLWVGKNMPNPDRFYQLFSHLPVTSSSRYHALVLGSSLSKAVDSLIAASNNLPSISLIVLDDWCENTGKIPNSSIDQVTRLGKSLDDNIRLILISKGTIDASGKKRGAIFARSENLMLTKGFEIWTFFKHQNSHHRNLLIDNDNLVLNIVDNGLMIVD